MLKIVLLALAFVVVAFLVVAALQPAEFRITRSARVVAPAATVFDELNDFHKWEAWSPWARIDPKAKNSFSGPAAGVGAGFAWVGNSQAGEGRMTITESRPNELIRIKLEFLKPFAATNLTEFTLAPEAAGTAVTWTMSGRNGFLSKAFGLLVNCDKMVGGQFEQGLANIKAIVEKPAGS
jgi:carbon monoxide dehydrogenase subunit G